MLVRDHNKLLKSANTLDTFRNAQRGVYYNGLNTFICNHMYNGSHFGTTAEANLHRLSLAMLWRVQPITKGLNTNQ